MTFTVTDALMSPLGLAVLTGAGLSENADVKHIHVTYDVALDSENGVGTIKFANLADELGVASTATIEVCKDEALKPYATVLDGNGAIIDWVDEVKLTGTDSTTLENVIDVKEGQDLTVTAESESAKGRTIKVDFYVRMTTGATEITVGPDDFGGYFYVEADTLYRNQDGKDMAATLTFPKVKIQSGFTLTMAPNGDPSTFDFTMDAFPAYTYFDQTHKVVCDITIVSGVESEDTSAKHSTPVEHEKLDYSVKLSKVDDTEVSKGKIIYTVTRGANCSGFETKVTVNEKAVTPTVVDDKITISNLTTGSVVAVTVTSKNDTTKTDTATYTVA